MKQVDAKAFHSAIKAGKASNPNGWMVSLHSESEYKGMRCFLSEDGYSGFALNGKDVVSVFTHSKTKGQNRLATMIPTAIAMGGRTLDCYGGGLQNLYSRFGAKATGKVAFDEQYAPDDWDGSHYPVVAMTLPSSWQSSVSGYSTLASVDLDKVRDYDDYDGMMADREKGLASSSGLGNVNG